MATIMVPVLSYVQYDLTQAEEIAMDFFITHGNHVLGIKFVRASRNLGLKEAKDLYDYYKDHVTSVKWKYA